MNNRTHAQTGWCARRIGDGYAPGEHDGSFDHARLESCLHFVSDREPNQVLTALWRLDGVDGDGITTSTIASVAGLSVSRTRTALRRLNDKHWVIPVGRGTGHWLEWVVTQQGATRIEQQTGSI